MSSKEAVTGEVRPLSAELGWISAKPQTEEHDVSVDPREPGGFHKTYADAQGQALPAVIPWKPWKCGNKEFREEHRRNTEGHRCVDKGHGIN